MWRIFFVAIIGIDIGLIDCTHNITSKNWLYFPHNTWYDFGLLEDSLIPPFSLSPSIKKKHRFLKSEDSYSSYTSDRSFEIYEETAALCSIKTKSL